MAPIKRHEVLQPLSREHHHTLLLVWKIKNGIKKNIEPERIKNYCDWYFQNHLKQHFATEEKELEKILPKENILFNQMKEEHSFIESLLSEKASISLLQKIAEALQNHVRFEERELFNLVQDVATKTQWENFQMHHTDEKFVENTTDEFWI